jgi:transcription antitermination factor NusG
MNTKKKWMVLYTRSRWEKKVSKSLLDNNFTSYCPLVKTTSKWVDRIKTIELPLFRSYIFVYGDDTDLGNMLQTNGILSYIKYGGKPAVIDDTEIDNIKEIVKKYSNIETFSISALNVGDRAIIRSGPLFDLSGEISRINGKKVVMIINSLDCVVTINTDKQELSLQSTDKQSH